MACFWNAAHLDEAFSHLTDINKGSSGREVDVCGFVLTLPSPIVPSQSHNTTQHEMLWKHLITPKPRKLLCEMCHFLLPKMESVRKIWSVKWAACSLKGGRNRQIIQCCVSGNRLYFLFGRGQVCSCLETGWDRTATCRDAPQAPRDAATSWRFKLNPVCLGYNNIFFPLGWGGAVSAHCDLGSLNIVSGQVPETTPTEPDGLFDENLTLTFPKADCGWISTTLHPLGNTGLSLCSNSRKFGGGWILCVSS